MAHSDAERALGGLPTAQGATGGGGAACAHMHTCMHMDACTCTCIHAYVHGQLQAAEEQRARQPLNLLERLTMC